MAYFINDTCIGCTVCELKCPVDTISGKPKELYVIHEEGCIDCGVCAIYCPVSCIEDQYGNLVTRIRRRNLLGASRRCGAEGHPREDLVRARPLLADERDLDVLVRPEPERDRDPREEEHDDRGGRG